MQIRQNIKNIHQMLTTSGGSDPCCKLILASSILLYWCFSQSTVNILSKVFKIVSLNCQFKITKTITLHIINGLENAANVSGQLEPNNQHHTYSIIISIIITLTLCQQSSSLQAGVEEVHKGM